VSFAVLSLVAVAVGQLGNQSLLAAFGLFFIAVVVGAIVVEHTLARREPLGRSWVTDAVQPRAYRGGRRFFIIVFGMAIVFTYKDDMTWLTLVFVAAIIYTLDRVTPVLNPSDQVEKGGTSPWLAGLSGIIVVTTAVGVILQVSVTELSDSMQDKVARVRMGHPLRYTVADPLALAEPRADRLLVGWSGPRAPHPFSAHGEIELMYFGQNNGTSLFLSIPPETPAVYRFPSAMLSMHTPQK
jgi:hypothetical protein